MPTTPINPANLLQLQVRVLDHDGEQIAAALGQADATAPLEGLQQQLADLAQNAFEDYSAAIAA